MSGTGLLTSDYADPAANAVALGAASPLGAPSPDVLARLRAQQKPTPAAPAAAPKSPETNLTMARQQREAGENPSRDPNAQNPFSTAGGNNQIIDGTWLELMNKYHPEKVQGQTKEQVLAMKRDGDLNNEMAGKYDEDNARFLASNGIAPTPNFINALYRAGPGDGLKLIQAARENPNAMVKDIAPALATPGNNGAGNLSVGQFLMNPYQRGPGAQPGDTPQQAFTIARGNQILSEMLSDQQAGKARLAKIDRDYKPVEVPPPPKPPETDPLRGFSSLAGVFAALASGFSRTPAIAAMNGLAGAMDAAKKSDWETYKANYDQFKTQSALALQAHDQHAGDMRDALEMMTKNMSAGTAMLNATMALSDDQEMRKHQQTGDFVAMGRLQDERDQKAKEWALGQPVYEATAQLTAAMHNYDAAQKGGDPNEVARAGELVQQAENKLAGVKRATSGGSATGYASPQTVEVKQPDGTTKTTLAQQDRGSGQWVTADAARTPIQGEIIPAKEARDERKEVMGKITPDTAHQAAEQLLAGDRSVLANYGRGAQGSENLSMIRNEYTKLAAERGVSGADQAAINAAFQGAVAASRTLGTTGARIDLGAQELKALIPQAKETSSKVVRWGATPIDRLVQALMGATNDPDLADFATTNQSVANAFAQVLTRGGASTEGARTHAYELLSTVRDQTSYSRVLDRLKKEADTIQEASREAKADVAKQILSAGRVGVASEPGASDRPPEAALKTLQPNHETVFSNGQVWTIGPDGQPVKVR